MRHGENIDWSVKVVEHKATEVTYEVLYLSTRLPGSTPGAWAVKDTGITDVDDAYRIAVETARIYRRVEVRRITRTFSVDSIWRMN